MTRDLDSYKLYLADTGLFVTLMFMDRPVAENELYAKLLSDKLPANLGYLYENLVAQLLTACGRELYYHTWAKADSVHYYEIDFLLGKGAKITALEVKSSGTGKHASLTVVRQKFSQNIGQCIILSQKDIANQQELLHYPLYLTSFLTS